MRLNQKKSPWGKAAGSLFALLLALMPMLTSVYTTHVISVAMISYLCVLSVYVLLGLCGQNSFAQAGLWGVGAYLAGNILTKTGGGTLAAFCVAVLGTALTAGVPIRSKANFISSSWFAPRQRAWWCCCFAPLWGGPLWPSGTMKWRRTAWASTPC